MLDLISAPKKNWRFCTEIESLNLLDTIPVMKSANGYLANKDILGSTISANKVILSHVQGQNLQEIVLCKSRRLCTVKSLKGRCARENCKYLHPPPHLKTQLEINGRNNLIQQKSAAAMFAQQMQFMFQNAQMPSVNSFPVNPAIAANPAMAYNPYLPHHPGMGLVPAELVQNTPVLISGNPPLPLPGAVGPKPIRSDKLEVCREFQRGNCTRGENDCRYAHPTDVSMIEASDNTVTICMDYIKGRCSREKCKYFHPPAHLQAKLKAAHYQMNHSAATAMGLQPGALQLIPKRSALEKVNCAPPVFNPNVFHCQQALPNMPMPQPQPQPQFIPTVEILNNRVTDYQNLSVRTSTWPFYIHSRSRSQNQIGNY
ncbi:hypothetical protein JEQ12_020381 [Ovis aries]|uniref:C3H1-type domain-containing protein n=1 Tax=Ovis aries TaxID=9940 RepID=A0A836CPF0_SHEEP|nr:hypothetical protein JEQ12_020381 [Ovis aries]